MWSLGRRTALLFWIVTGLVLSGVAVNGALVDAGSSVVATATVAQQAAPERSAALNNSAAIAACDYPGACSPPAPPKTLQCGVGTGIYSPRAGVIVLSDVDPCIASVTDQLVGCTLQSASIGWGTTSLPLDSISEGVEFLTSASADAINAENGTTYELYDCAGFAVTVVRDVYLD